MLAGLQSALPKSRIQVIQLDRDEVPGFEDHVGPDEEAIAPPLDHEGRGTYVSSVCGPMASKKSLQARIYTWSRKGVDVVIAVRQSQAYNALQEGRESAPEER